MIETLEIKIKGHKYQISKGATLEEIANQFQKDYRYPILLAKVNNVLKELTHEIPDQADIEFIDLTSKEGNRTHISGLTYILLYAVKRLYGKDANIYVQHSLFQSRYKDCCKV